jgi:hypothetical protein
MKQTHSISFLPIYHILLYFNLSIRSSANLPSTHLPNFPITYLPILIHSHLISFQSPFPILNESHPIIPCSRLPIFPFLAICLSFNFLISSFSHLTIFQSSCLSFFLLLYFPSAFPHLPIIPCSQSHLPSFSLSLFLSSSSDIFSSAHLRIPPYFPLRPSIHQSFHLLIYPS